MIEVDGTKFYSVLDVAKMINATPQTVRKYNKWKNSGTVLSGFQKYLYQDKKIA